MNARMLFLVFIFLSADIVAQSSGNFPTPQVLIGCTDSAVAEGFALDAGLYANTTFFNSDDWFTDSLGGSGFGVIGLTSATAQPPVVLSARDFRDTLVGAPSFSDANITYVQRMAVAPGTMLYDSSGSFRWMLDAVATRDNFGSDSSISVSANFRNNYNPLIDWRPGIGTVAATTDMVDAGAHLRRTFSDAGLPGDLWLYAFTTLYDSGSNYVDVEVFRNQPVFNVTSNTVSNSGSASTGGHSAASFFVDASLVRLGDMIFSANYTQTGDISVRIWVNPLIMRQGFVAPTIADGFSAFNALPNRPFNFTGTFNSGPITGGYGYAEITPLNQLGCPAYVKTNNNTSSIPGTPWGNYAAGDTSYLDNIGNHRMLEMGINLSRFGIDKPTITGNCANVMGSILFKTRVGLGFAGPTYDYAGPFTFAAFPEINASAGPDAVVTCDSSQLVLTGSTTTPFSIYQWYSFNGTILSGANTLSPLVDGPGTYYFLVNNILLGSCEAIDSVVVRLNTEPVVTANGDSLISTSASFYQWYRNGVAIPGATDQLYVALQGGDYSVEATDSLGCSSFSNSVTVIIAGIKDPEILNISLHPNPVNSQLQLDVTGVIQSSFSVRVYSIMGAQLFDSKYNTGSSVAIDVSALSSGIYYLVLDAGGKQVVRRFIKN